MKGFASKKALSIETFRNFIPSQMEDGGKHVSATHQALGQGNTGKQGSPHMLLMEGPMRGLVFWVFEALAQIVTFGGTQNQVTATSGSEQLTNLHE